MKFVVTTDVLGTTTVKLHPSTKRKLRKVAAVTTILAAAAVTGYKNPQLVIKK